MPKKIEIEKIFEEFDYLNKKHNRKWKLLNVESKKVQKKIRNINHSANTRKYATYWFLTFECEKKHLLTSTLGNVRKIKNCSKCKGINITLRERINILKKVHNNFFSYHIFEKQGFSSAKDKITIVCPLHGCFQQQYQSHRNGANGCSYCTKQRQKTVNDLKDLIYKKTDGLLHIVDLEKKKTYRTEDLIKVKCSLYNWHPANTIKVRRLIERDKTLNCFYCKSSRYERDAYFALNKLGISFEHEKKIEYDDGTFGFVDIVVNHRGEKKFIEIDGQQHENIDLSWHKNSKDKEKLFLDIKKRDLKKEKFCKQKNIDLIRISYRKDIKEEIFKLFGSKQIFNDKFSTQLSIKKFFPHLKETKAYRIHIMYNSGLSLDKISRLTNLNKSYISRIVNGTLFTELFKYLYKGKSNPYIRTKKYTHFKIKEGEEEFIKKMLREGKLHTNIKKEFDKIFRKIPIGQIKTVAINNKIRSKYWLDLSENEIKIIRSLRADGNSYLKISNKFRELTGKSISKPSVIKLFK